MKKKNIQILSTWVSHGTRHVKPAAIPVTCKNILKDNDTQYISI